MQIQELDESNVEEVSLLLGREISLNEFYEVTEAIECARELNPNRLKSLLYSPTDIGFVAMNDNQVVGTLIGFQEKKCAYIRWVVVRQDSRRVGLAQHLMLKFEDWAKKRRLYSASGDVKLENYKSLKLCQKMGYTILQSLNGYVTFFKNLM